MKYIFSIYLLLLSVTVFSQGQIPQGNINSLTVNKGGFKADTVLLIPERDTTKWKDTYGNLTIRPQDGNLWMRAGGVWKLVGTGGGGSTDTTSLSNRINQKQNYSDTLTYDATKYWVLQRIHDTTSLSNRINTKQNQLSGTGFVKASGTTIIYDNTNYTPTTRELTINGITQDLTTNRTWTIPSGDTTSLSNRINQKQDQLNGIGIVRMMGTTATYDNTDYVPVARTLTINGQTFDLSSNRTWTIPGMDTTSLSLRINNKQDKLTGDGLVRATAGVVTYDTSNYLTAEVDGSVTNELQSLSRSGQNINLSLGGGSVVDSNHKYSAGTNISITGSYPNYTVNASGIDTTSLSNRINTKQSYSDTLTYDATKTWVNSRGYIPYTDTLTRISTKQNLKDTTTVLRALVKTTDSLNIKQGGNSFGIPMVIGTNDNQPINIEKNNTVIGIISNNSLNSNLSLNSLGVDIELQVNSSPIFRGTVSTPGGDTTTSFQTGLLNGRTIFSARQGTNMTLFDVRSLQTRMGGSTIFGSNSVAPTHTLTIPSVGTGIAQYNTANQTTNYERVRQYWSGDIFNIASERGGTGSNRNLIYSGFPNVTYTGTITLKNAPPTSTGYRQLVWDNVDSTIKSIAPIDITGYIKYSDSNTVFITPRQLTDSLNGRVGNYLQFSDTLTKIATKSDIISASGGTIQSLSNTKSGNNIALAISGGGAGTNFSVADADSSITNEIQTLGRTGTSITLTNGGSVVDSSKTYIAGTNISITGTYPTYTVAVNPTGLLPNKVNYTDSNTVYVTPYQLNDSIGKGVITVNGAGIATGSTNFNVNQKTNTTATITVPGTNLGSSKVGSTVTITTSTGTSTSFNIDDGDASLTNEIQTLGRTGNTITLSNGGGSVIDSFANYTAGTNMTRTGTYPNYTFNANSTDLSGYIPYTDTLNRIATKQNITDTSAVLRTLISDKEDAFSKGSIVAGANITTSGTISNRLVGAGNVTINADLSSAVKYSDTNTVISTKKNLIDTATSLRTTINTKQNQLNGTGFVKASGTTITYDNSVYVPITRTLTINGNTQDLSTNRNWNIPVIDTNSLSNRINTKQSYSDTLTWDATKSNLQDTASSLRTLINNKEDAFLKGNVIAGTGVTFTGSGVGRLVGNGNLTVNATPTDLSGVVKYTDTLTRIATRSYVDTAKANIRAEKENVFSKGSIVAGSNVTLSGTLTNRLVGAGNITINATAIDTTSLSNRINTKIDLSEKAQPNGVATLGGDGKVPTSQLPDAILGAVIYQGTYSVVSNTPTLPTATGNKGKYYVVTDSGLYAPNSTIYRQGDWIISNGVVWQKVDNNNNVTSVNGQVGAVTIIETDPVYTASIPNQLMVKSVIPGSANLDDYTTTGIYIQASNANASSGTNYPEPYAGKLEVVNDGSFTYQTYHTYLAFQKIWYRARQGTTWSNWVQISTSTGTVESVAASVAGTALNVAGSPITSTGTLAFTWGGNTGQYVNGAGGLTTFPSTVSNLALGTRTATTIPITNSNGTGVTLPSATTSLAGLMAASDKAKLDTLNNYVLPIASNTVLGGIKVGSGLSITGDGTLSSTGSGGTVTNFSSGNLSPLFTTSVATSTTTPALSFSLTNAGANTWFGNATGSSTSPSYNNLGALTKTDDANVTLTLGGTPATALAKNVSLTLGWTGLLNVARGGTGAGTLTGYVKGNGTSPFTASSTIPWTDITGAPSTASNLGSSKSGSAVTITNDNGTGTVLNISDADSSALNELQNLSLGTATSTTRPLNISSGTGVTLPSATTSAAGLLSAADKTKLDGLTNYTLPIATASVLGGVKIGSGISVAGDGTISAAIPTVNNGTLTLGTSGIATGSASFTANQSAGSTFTVNVPGTNLSSSTSGSTVTVASSTGTNTSFNVGVLTETDPVWTVDKVNTLTFKASISAEDFNTLIEPGLYERRFNTPVMPNQPLSGTTAANIGALVVTHSRRTGNLTIFQEFKSIGGSGLTDIPRFFNRRSYDGGATWSPWIESGTGTVSSVALAAPSAFTVSGSPVTGSGTLTLAGAGSTAQYIRGDGTLATFPTIPTYTGSTSITLSSGSFQRAALTGDVTAAANSNATTIANDAVTYAKMQNIATQTLIGRGATGTGDPGAVTIGSGLSLSSGNVLSNTGVITDKWGVNSSNYIARNHLTTTADGFSTGSSNGTPGGIQTAGAMGGTPYTVLPQDHNIVFTATTTCTLPDPAQFQYRMLGIKLWTTGVTVNFIGTHLPQESTGAVTAYTGNNSFMSIQSIFNPSAGTFQWIVLQK